MRYTEFLINEVYPKVDIEDLVDELECERGKGRGSILATWRNDETEGSCRIYRDEELGLEGLYDFADLSHGPDKMSGYIPKVELVMLMKRMSFFNAMRWLCTYAKVPFPYNGTVRQNGCPFYKKDLAYIGLKGGKVYKTVKTTPFKEKNSIWDKRSETYIVRELVSNNTLDDFWETDKKEFLLMVIDKCDETRERLENDIFEVVSLKPLNHDLSMFTDRIIKVNKMRQKAVNLLKSLKEPR